MAESIELKIPSFILEDYDSLVEESLEYIKYISNGQLYSLGNNSAVRFILEAQIWAFRELLFKANSLPRTDILYFLSEVVGVQQNLGTKAVVNLQVALKRPQEGTFLLPEGFAVYGTNSDTVFYTLTDLEIPPGETISEVQAQSELVGSLYNLPAFTLNSFTSPRANLDSIQNLEPASGGTDLETIEDVLIRGAQQVKRRDVIISADDLKEEIVTLLGVGSTVVKPIQWYEPFGSNNQGETTVYTSDAFGNTLDLALTRFVQSAISPKLPLGCYITVKSIQTLSVDCEVFLFVNDSIDPEQVATEIYAEYQSYFSDTNREIGETVYLFDITQLMGNSLEVIRVGSLRLNEKGLDIIMPTPFTKAVDGALLLNISDTSGNSYGPYYFGQSANYDG